MEKLLVTMLRGKVMWNYWFTVNEDFVIALCFLRIFLWWNCNKVLSINSKKLMALMLLEVTYFWSLFLFVWFACYVGLFSFLNIVSMSKLKEIFYIQDLFETRIACGTRIHCPFWFFHWYFHTSKTLNLHAV